MPEVCRALLEKSSASTVLQMAAMPVPQLASPVVSAAAAVAVATAVAAAAAAVTVTVTALVNAMNGVDAIPRKPAQVLLLRCAAR